MLCVLYTPRPESCMEFLSCYCSPYYLIHSLAYFHIFICFPHILPNMFSGIEFLAILSIMPFDLLQFFTVKTSKITFSLNLKGKMLKYLDLTNSQGNVGNSLKQRCQYFTVQVILEQNTQYIILNIRGGVINTSEYILLSSLC